MRNGSRIILFVSRRMRKLENPSKYCVRQIPVLPPGPKTEKELSGRITFAISAAWARLRRRNECNANVLIRDYFRVVYLRSHHRNLICDSCSHCIFATSVGWVLVYAVPDYIQKMHQLGWNSKTLMDWPPVF